ncbi:ribosome-associated factor Y [Clostridium tepidiprofundi DSM 19306]|uniref:Ribosome hibernation promoting factor n=1 Tax=Clostridium tepidiprofundi DSM 19306 TaxID=1121338 RepID=A0A151AY05_9CLOT|nr:ribosome-associated translation inhibitor RaiA [Clostridium tepidiprofundi]KYH32432.1 ribosome-associated factor Y [Clostridium tepidiprofundi DSM 19306]
MKVRVIGKNIKVTEALKNIVEKKMSRFDRYFKPDIEAFVRLDVQKNTHIVEVTIPFNGVILRAEEANEDMYVSIDLVLDKVERQIRKQKTRLEKRSRGDALIYHLIPKEDEHEEEPKIVRTKRFAIKPMSAEEAVLQMDLLGHNFYVYRDADTSDINVVYKRKDGNYGLIEPEL